MKPTAWSLSIGLLLFVLFAWDMPVQAQEQPAYQRPLNRALSRYRRKDYAEAVRLLTLVLKDFPQLPEAYLHRAAARAKLDDIQGAIDDYTRVMEINPNIVEAYTGRAQLYKQQGKHQEAIADITGAIKLHPHYASGYLTRARTYTASGSYEKAVEDYDNALKYDKRSIEARQERAEAKTKLRDYAGAIEDYQELLKRHKRRLFDLHYDLARVLNLKGDQDAARAELTQITDFYSRALQRTRKKGWDYLKRGLAHLELGNQAEAMSDLEAGLALLPGDARALYHLGAARLASGQQEAGIEDLKQALQIDPKLHAAQIALASAFIDTNKIKDALKYLNSALAEEQDADGFLYRALARSRLGDPDGALSDVLRATQLNPETVERMRQQLQKVAGEGTREQSQNIDLAHRLIHLAVIELSGSNYASAEGLVKRAIGIQEKTLKGSDPEIACSLMLLGKVYLRQAALPQAQALLLRALSILQRGPAHDLRHVLFALEDCGRKLLLSGKPEEAGALFMQTRMIRASTGIKERPFDADLSKQVDYAIDAYRQKKKDERQALLTRKLAAIQAAPDAESEEKKVIDKPIRDKWAVIVGISDFADTKINLKYASKDARDFYEFLIKEKNFAPDHVQLLTDKQATRANILSVLGSKWLPRLAEPDDLVVIYFSSHGSPSALDVGGVNYLVAHDTDVNDLYATGIAMQDLTRIIKARVHSDRIMLLLDACYSGVADASGKGLVRTGNINIDSIVQGTGQLVISSSKPDERSWESSRYQGSVFTKHLIEGLRKNGMLTKLDDAFNHLRNEVSREVLRDRGLLQTPVLKSKWEGKDLMLGVEPANPVPGLADIELPDKPAEAKPAQEGGKTLKAAPAHAKTRKSRRRR